MFIILIYVYFTFPSAKCRERWGLNSEMQKWKWVPSDLLKWPRQERNWRVKLLWKLKPETTLVPTQHLPTNQEGKEKASLQKLMIKIKQEVKDTSLGLEAWIPGINPVCPCFTAISMEFWQFTSPLCHEICPLFHTQQSPGRVVRLQTWPCRKRWYRILRPSGKLLSQTTFNRVSLQAQRHRACLNRCHGRTLDSALFSWSQAENKALSELFRREPSQAQDFQKMSI